MSHSNDWVEDVKRWCRSGAGAGVNSMAANESSAASLARPSDDEYSAAVGYEAANPMLQARHWPESAAGAAPIGR